MGFGHNQRWTRLLGWVGMCACIACAFLWSATWFRRINLGSGRLQLVLAGGVVYYCRTKVTGDLEPLRQADKLMFDHIQVDMAKARDASPSTYRQHAPIFRLGPIAPTSNKWPVRRVLVNDQLVYTVTVAETGVPFWMPFALLAGGTIFAWRRTRRRNLPGRCAVCDYDLHGNVSGRCSECGTPIPRAAEARTA